MMQRVDGERLIYLLASELGAEVVNVLEVVGCKDGTTHYIDAAGDGIPDSTLCGRRRAFHLILTPRRGVNPVDCETCRERARERSLRRT